MAHTATASILFCDLVGSTERLVGLGDDQADEFIGRFLAECRAVVEEHGGQVVKTLGDGLEGVFERRTLDAIEAALDLHVRIAALDPDDPPVLRVGLSVGEVSFENGDWYGRPVIEAARLCSVAPGSQTYATELVRAIVGSRGSINFIDCGALKLRGLPERVPTIRIEPAAVVADRGRGTVPGGDGGRAELGRRERRSNRRRAWLVTAVAGVIALVAVSATAWAATRDDTTTERTRSTVEVIAYTPRYEKRPCPDGTADATKTCGVLHVPMNRSHPDGPWITVPLDSWTAIGTSNRRVALSIGSVVDEGQSPTRLIGRHLRLGVRGREGDPFLNCPEVTVAGKAHLLDPLYSDAAVSSHVTALRACRDRWTAKHVDVSSFSEADVALDARDAIKALSLPKVDVLTGTDQSPAALSLMRDRPELLRSVTLINPEAPDMSTGQLVMSFRAAFEAYATLCKANANCNRVLPDPEATWQQVYQRYQASPAYETGTMADGQPLQILMDGDRGASALEVAVGSVPLLPYLHLTLTGDAALAASGNAYEKSDTSDQVPIGADLSDVCHRIVPNDKPIDHDEIDRYPEFRSGRFRLVAESCAAWSVPPAPLHFRSAVASSVPTFIVVGSLSTATSPDAIDGLVRGLDHATVMRFPTLGFSPMYDGPSCLFTIWRAWLVHPEPSPTAADINACVASAPPVPFLATL